MTSVDLNVMEKAVQQIDEILCIFKLEIGKVLFIFPLSVNFRKFYFSFDTILERINAVYRANLANKEIEKQTPLEPEVLQVQESDNTHTSSEVIIVQEVSTNNVQNSENKYEEEEQQILQTPENMTSLNIPLIIIPTVHTEETVSTNEKDNSKCRFSNCNTYMYLIYKY